MGDDILAGSIKTYELNNTLFPALTVLKYSVNYMVSVNYMYGVDKKNQVDVTFCILYFSSNSCSTCFGQPCANHQKLTTA